MSKLKTYRDNDWFKMQSNLGDGEWIETDNGDYVNLKDWA